MRAKRFMVLGLLVTTAAAVTAPAQVIQGQVEAVGFPAGPGSAIREGQWFPVRVLLQPMGSGVFTGELSLETLDLDGDIVHYRQPQVTAAGADGSPKRFWLYAAVNAAQDLPPCVDVLDRTGTVVAKLSMPQQFVADLHANDLLVVDISAQPVTRLTVLQTPAGAPGQLGDGIRPYYRGVVVSSMQAPDLPDRWIGLEAVDVIVWDRPVPEALSIAQRDALIAWVRAGGQLILGIGDRWEALRRSDLGPILPLEGDGPIVEVRRLPVFLNRVLVSPSPDAQFNDPVAVTTAQPRRDAFVTLGDAAPGAPAIALISMRYEGAGRVVAVAASLRDLTTAATGVRQQFFELLMELNPYTDGFRDAQQKSNPFGEIQQSYAYRPVTAPISFGTATAVRGLLAFAFVAGYVLLATLGTWFLLVRRNMTMHSWPAFATVAVVASLLSLVTVGALRGVSSGLRTLAILDVDAETGQSRGWVLLGYKSATRDSVSLQFGGDNTFVRPLAAPPEITSTYVTPERYIAQPAQGRVQNVAMRATLKQFEGYWEGDVGGRVLSDLVVDRQTGRITPGSWLRNDFDVPIEGGILLFIDPRLNDGAVGVPWRIAGWTGRYPVPEAVGGKNDVTVWPPAVNVLAVPVGALRPGDVASALWRSTYERVDTLYGQWSRRTNLQRSDMPDLPTLYDQQLVWAGAGSLPGLGGSLGPRQTLLLASTRSYYLHNSSAGNFNSVGRTFNTRGLPDVDISHWLVRGQAVLLCWSEEPAPITVQRDNQRMRPGGGMAIYRLRLPLRYESGQ